MVLAFPRLQLRKLIHLGLQLHFLSRTAYLKALIVVNVLCCGAGLDNQTFIRRSWKSEKSGRRIFPFNICR